jgi:hypothetical protein
MSRKLKATAVILAILMAITAYLGYHALTGIGDAFENNDIWTE